MSDRDKQVDKIMLTIPEDWRQRWCGGEAGPCACMGCVQIGNRVIMSEKSVGLRFMGDPEYIAEDRVPPEIYEEYKITKPEWIAWKERSGHD